VGATYRVRQFLAAVFPAVPISAAIDNLLDPAQRELFRRLAPAYQRHSLRVLVRLIANGQSDPDLLRAALLHDVGKSAAPIWLHHRVLHVLLARFAPSLAVSIANGSGRGWKRPFNVLANHATIGAELLRSRGQGDALVGLVARHHSPPSADDSPLLRALRQADGDE
jgi:putative nucleotidyltransferase with HDIG domain